SGFVQAWGIHKDDLPIRPADHAHDLVAGGLGPVGHNGHLFPHKPVHNAGFSHIGPAHDGHKARMKRFLFQNKYSLRRTPPYLSSFSGPKAWGNSSLSSLTS